MKTAGIFIDPWKLKKFSKMLTDAGFKFEQIDSNGMILLTVRTDSLPRLAEVVRAAEWECKKQ